MVDCQCLAEKSCHPAVSSGLGIRLCRLFNEDLFIYFVDIDFCRRLGGAGYGVYVCPEAVLLHREGTKKMA